MRSGLREHAIGTVTAFARLQFRLRPQLDSSRSLVRRRLVRSYHTIVKGLDDDLARSLDRQRAAAIGRIIQTQVAGIREDE